MTEKEKVLFCRDAFLVMDNLAYFNLYRTEGNELKFKVVDTDSKRHMIMRVAGKRIITVSSSLSEASYYKALYFTEVNKKLIMEEVFKHAKVR